MSKTSLIKSTGLIGIATAISRVLGFVRDMVIANFFGTSAACQAFVVAFRIPNMLRDLVAEGAANAAIVPVLTEYKAKKSEGEFLHLYRVVFNIFFIVLIGISVLGVIFSPLIVRVMAPGFIQESEKLNLTIQLNRLLFPYIFFVGLAAVTMGVLNSLGHFWAPAFGSCFLNVTLIAATVYLGPRIGVFSLAIGVLAGGALQLGLNIPVLYRKGLSLRFRDGFRHSAGRKIGLLLIPRVAGSAVYQINIFVDTILASLAWIVGAGGIAALYYANRLIQFPLGIFSIALAQAALPKMSEEAAMGDNERLKDTLSFSLRMVMLIILPASFGFVFLGKPIIRILFERGQFDFYSTSITQQALFFYSFGLLAYSGIKMLVTCFYSLHDTMTPVKTAALAVALNVMLNLILMWPLKLGGLALATSISAMVNFFMLFFILRRKIGRLDERRLLRSFFRIFLASAVTGAACHIMSILFRLEGLRSGLSQALVLCLIIAASIAAYVAACLVFRVTEMKEIFAWISKRR
jgi:putative peptidoglycan lipid II flippase